MGFTGAADRIDSSGGFGQGETRPQAFTGLNGRGYVIGRTQDRIIEIADMSDPDTSTYVSAVIGNPNSMASHNGSLYVFLGRDLLRFDVPFSDTDTGTDIFTINETPRALTSDGTNLYYIHQLSVLNFLYRIDDLDGTPTAVSLGRVGAGNANIRGLSWHDGFFWGVDATTDKLVKITLTEDSDDPHTIENVGSYSQFVGPITNPQGFGIVDGVGYVSALDNDGSLWELQDFKFTSEISDQTWTVGTAVNLSAPATEDGETPIIYAISPALPAGVTLDTSTGDISGDPTAETAEADYTLTATDDNGIETTTTFSASVAASGGVTLTPPTFTAPTSDYEVNEREDDTIDSTEFFSGHTSLVFKSGTTPPSWATISGLDIVITDAPDVTDDTDYDIELTATNNDGDVAGTITVSVQQIDPAPVIGTLSQIDVNEGASKTVDLSGSLQNTDTLVITSSHSWVSISGLSLVITNAPSVSADTDYTVNLRVESDATSETDTGSVVIRVANVPIPLVNSAPSFQDASYSFSDVAIAVNTVIGTVAATDADNDTLSYSLTGTDASSFTIDSDGEIAVSTALDNSTTYNFNVVADDQTDTTSAAVTVITIAATPVNNAPSFSESSYAFTDVAIVVNTVVGTVAATDADNDTLSYSLTGTDAGNFSIDSDGELTVATALTHLDTYTFYVVADDGTDTTSVVVTITAEADPAEIVILKSPDALTLYKQALNKETTPSEAGNNDYSTWTTQTTITCDIRDNEANAQTFDTIFVKCSGVDSYTVSVGTDNLGSRTVPSTIRVEDAYPAIDDISITREGWQHDLIEIDEQTGSSVVLTFTGTNVRVNEVLILKKSLILNDNYTKISHSKVDIDSEFQKSEQGNERREIIVGTDRLRWMSSCSLEFTFNDDNYEVFLDWIEDNPNAVVAQNPEIYPWRVYKTVFPDLTHNAPYLCSVREAGNVVSFRLLENRIIGSGLTQEIKRTFNTVDSQDKYLFFNDCIHLNNERVKKLNGDIDYNACDNNFETYSAETTLELDISDQDDETDVTHIWLKSTGVTSYEVQTRVGATWTTQYTITPTQKTYRGWDNSLEKLSATITETRVRLVFTGSNTKIAEVMLLEHAGGLVSLSNILPTKTDRTSVIQQTQSGETERTKTELSSRFKWQLNFSAAFGYNNTHKLEDFLDWIGSNPNFTFAERPIDNPWRVYPAGFLNSGFNAAFITRAIQIGELVSCQLSER